MLIVTSAAVLVGSIGFGAWAALPAISQTRKPR